MTADEIPPLADAVYRDRVERARRQSPAESFAESLALYDEVVSRQKAAIRGEFPDADERRVHEILPARLRRAQEYGLYRPDKKPPGRPRLTP